MPRKTRTFSDLNLDFLPHPVTDDVAKRFDEDAIKRSVRHLVMTMHFERPFNSALGSSVYGLLFEPSSPMLDVVLKREITYTIENWEPRVDLIDVVVNVRPDNHTVEATIHFRIINTTRPLQMELLLTRTR